MFEAEGASDGGCDGGGGDGCGVRRADHGGGELDTVSLRRALSISILLLLLLVLLLLLRLWDVAMGALFKERRRRRRRRVFCGIMEVAKCEGRRDRGGVRERIRARGWL